MTAAQPFASPDRGAEQRAHEPSMEEILASIRRIIADDQAFTSRVNGPAATHETSDADAEASYETAVEVSPEPVAVMTPVEAVAAAMPVPEPELEPAMSTHSSMPPFDVLRGTVDSAPPIASERAAPPRAAPPADEVPLVSPRTDSSVSSAFGALVATQFLKETAAMPDLIREMVRPMLKTWLDDNLPTIVERLVRVEIERVARGGH